MTSSLGRAVLITRVASRLAGARWRRLRALYLQQHPACECGRPDCKLSAVTVVHRRPRGNDPALFYDWNNLQALSRPCQRRKIEEGQ